MDRRDDLQLLGENSSDSSSEIVVLFCYQGLWWHSFSDRSVPIGRGQDCVFPPVDFPKVTHNIVTSTDLL